MLRINRTMLTRRITAIDKLFLNKIKYFSSNNKCISENNPKIYSLTSFYKTNKKNFFGPFKSKIKSYDDLIMNKTDDAPREEKWYETSETLVFQNGKYPLLKASKKDTRMVKIFEYVFVLPALAVSGYKFLTSLVFLKPLGSIFWGAILFFVARIYQGTRQNKYFFIYNLNLLEDGKRVEVGKEGKNIIADISKVRRLTPEEAIYFAQVMPDVHISYIPIIINDQFYLIFKTSTVLDQEIFSAISSGQYVKVKEDKKINKEEAIDIESK